MASTVTGMPVSSSSPFVSIPSGETPPDHLPDAADVDEDWPYRGQDPHDASFAVTFGKTDESDLVCGGQAISSCQQGLYGCTKAAIYSAFALTFGTLATIWFGVWMGATRFYIVYLMSPLVRILTIAMEPVRRLNACTANLLHPLMRLISSMCWAGRVRVNIDGSAARAVGLGKKSDGDQYAHAPPHHGHGHGHGGGGVGSTPPLGGYGAVGESKP